MKRIPNSDHDTRIDDFGILDGCVYFQLNCYIIIIINMHMRTADTLYAMQGRERVKTLLSVQRPQPHTTNIWKEEEDKIVGDTN